MKTFLLTLLAAASLAQVLPAAPITWTVQNAQFTDGATLTGAFVYDPTTNVASSWNLTVTAGPNFTDFNYTSSDPNSFFYYNNFGFPTTEGISFGLNGSSRRVFLQTSNAVMTNAGGSVALDFTNPNGISGECFGCNPYRLLNTGNLFGVTTTPGPAPTPEPSTLALFGSGLITLGVISRRKL